MKYQIPEDFKPKAIQRNRISMAVYYTIGILIVGYQLITGWEQLGLKIKLPLILMCAACPLAWFYFDKKFKSQLTLTYELTDTHLLRKVDGDVKSKFLLKSIYEVKESANGLKVKSESETFIIPNTIDGLSDLAEKIKPVANKT